MSESESTPKWAVLQICCGAATTVAPSPPPTSALCLPPLGLQEHSPGKEGERAGAARGQGLLWTSPLWLQGPSLLHLSTLTLSPRDPLSRRASSGQQPQQQHIPTQTLPSSERPWHCLVLLSWRQSAPSPRAQAGEARRTEGRHPGAACSRVKGPVCFSVLLLPSILKITPVTCLPTSQQDSPPPHDPICLPRKRAHYPPTHNTHSRPQRPFLLASGLYCPVSRLLLSYKPSQKVLLHSLHLRHCCIKDEMNKARESTRTTAGT